MCDENFKYFLKMCAVVEMTGCCGNDRAVVEMTGRCGNDRVLWK